VRRRRQALIAQETAVSDRPTESLVSNEAAEGIGCWQHQNQYLGRFDPIFPTARNRHPCEGRKTKTTLKQVSAAEARESPPRDSQEKFRSGRTTYFQGVTGGTLSVAGGMSTVLKSAGLTISRYSMSGE